jgi:hypothetical protein
VLPTFPVVNAGVPVHVGAVIDPITSCTDPPSNGTYATRPERRLDETCIGIVLPL